MYLTQGLHRGTRQIPHVPATIFGERVRTWAQSADRVARLAAAPRGIGVTDGGRVAILALNSDRCHAYLFAVVRAGGVRGPTQRRVRRGTPGLPAGKVLERVLRAPHRAGTDRAVH